jgi:DNA repair protein RadC
LATLGNLISVDHRSDPFGDHGGPFDLAARLCDRGDVLGVSDVGGVGAGYPCGQKDAYSLGSCANLLAGLLRPLVGTSSATLARRLLDEFSTFPDVLSADQARLRAVSQSESVARFIVLVRDAMLYSLRLHIGKRPILSSSDRLIDYLRASMGYSLTEQFRVLFLNAQNMLIRDQIMGLGSVLEAPVFPQEVFRRALEVGASAIVLVHNHPSGNLEPSDADLKITRRIVGCGRLLEITLNDHIIVTKAGFTSFRSRGLI